MADHMRNRVYVAERTFRDLHPECIGTVEGLQTYAEAICKRAWFKRYPGGGERVVSPTLHIRNMSVAKCLPSRADIHGEFVMWVPPSAWQPTRLDVMHSLTHFLLSQHNWGHGAQLHDGQFVKTYLDMVERFYGKAKDAAIRKEFKAILLSLNVKIRPVSEEQRVAARERWYARQVPDVRRDLQAQLDELEEDSDGDS